MDGMDSAKEMMKLWRGSWDSYLKTLGAMQEQGEKMMAMMLEQNPMMPEEARKAMQAWGETAKKTSQAYVEMAEGNLKKIDEFLEKK